MSSATGQLTCTQCKSDYSGPKRPMLRCSSCKKGWHTYCHSPVITVGQFKAMYEAEVNLKQAHPGAVRFSTWRCSLCLARSRADQSVIVISSDEEECMPLPKRNSVVAPSKSTSPVASTPTEDIVDLTEGSARLPSRKGGSRDTSPPRSRSQTFDLPGRKEHSPPITRARLGHSTTPPPLSATPSEPTIIIDEEAVNLKMNADIGRDEPLRPAPVQSLSPEPPRQTETRLLPQIIKEEMQEILIPPPTEPEKPRRPRKPKETKRFVSTSRRGKLRIKGLVNLHMPFGPETTPQVHLGTLEEALRKLGLEPAPGK